MSVDPFPPAARRRGGPGHRFGWCTDNHHDQCRATFTDVYDRPQVCACPCHEEVTGP